MAKTKAAARALKRKPTALYFLDNPKALRVAERAHSTAFKFKLGVLETEFGGARLARITGVDRSRISRWKRGAKADPANQERINNLEFVVSRLHGFMPATTSQKWLFGVNAHLNNCRPIDLIDSGRLSEVIAAVEQLELGSYA